MFPRRETPSRDMYAWRIPMRPTLMFPRPGCGKWKPQIINLLAVVRSASAARAPAANRMTSPRCREHFSPPKSELSTAQSLSEELDKNRRANLVGSLNGEIETASIYDSIKLV